MGLMNWKKKNERVVNLIKSPDCFLYGWFWQNMYPLSKEELTFVKVLLHDNLNAFMNSTRFTLTM